MAYVTNEVWENNAGLHKKAEHESDIQGHERYARQDNMVRRGRKSKSRISDHS
jgi:hypothetical protein